jgi:hypothetical protein
MKILLTDPTSHSSAGVISNLGDIIIKDAVTDNLPEGLRAQIADWVPIDLWRTNIALRRDQILVLAGANIIANDPLLNPGVWRPNLRTALASQFVVLFGVVWWQYQGNPSFLTSLFYRRFLLDSGLSHSVRDAYTKSMLAKCGIANVINTGCPTMWKLPPRMDFAHKAQRVVFTLTDYLPSAQHDRALLDVLERNYEQLILFPQGTDDEKYFKSIATRSQVQGTQVLDRDIDSFNRLLIPNEIDYIGTRLHAGIRSLQRGVRTFVVSVDNRATEIARDTNLPVVERSAIDSLERRLNTEFSCSLRINREGIEEFVTSLERYFSA